MPHRTRGQATTHTKRIRARLEGRMIVDAIPGLFDDGRGGKAFDWTLKLDDGTILNFKVQETDSSLGYGVDILVSGLQEPMSAPKQKRAPKS